MKLTRGSSYAIRAVAFMSQKPNKDRLLPSYGIAAATGIPERFLLKILKSVSAAGILQSVKGPLGGYRLAKDPSEISILDIIEAVEGPQGGPAAPVDAGATEFERRVDAIVGN